MSQLSWAVALRYSLYFSCLIVCGFHQLVGSEAHLNEIIKELEYQDRGGRYAEGVKPRPVSGDDIDLISVLVDYKEASNQLPDQMKISFYLPQSSDVNIVVRELDFRLYYWLDRVMPPKATWRVGEQNEFVWSTSTVLRRLDETMDVYSLGVVVRLGRAAPAAVEDVAPAILYHTKQPTAVGGYLFTMKTNDDARLSCSIYREGNPEPLATQTFRRILGGRPFTVPWNAVGAQESRYRFVCTGFLLDTNQPLEQSVRFYHRQRVK